MTYRDFKELLRITASDRVLCDKAFNIAKNPIYDGYQCGLALMVYKLFDKKVLMVLLHGQTISRKIMQLTFWKIQHRL